MLLSGNLNHFFKFSNPSMGYQFSLWHNKSWIDVPHWHCFLKSLPFYLVSLKAKQKSPTFPSFHNNLSISAMSVKLSQKNLRLPQKGNLSQVKKYCHNTLVLVLNLNSIYFDILVKWRIQSGFFGPSKHSKLAIMM